MIPHLRLSSVQEELPRDLDFFAGGDISICSPTTAFSKAILLALMISCRGCPTIACLRFGVWFDDHLTMAATCFGTAVIVLAKVVPAIVAIKDSLAVSSSMIPPFKSKSASVERFSRTKGASGKFDVPTRGC